MADSPTTMRDFRRMLRASVREPLAFDMRHGAEIAVICQDIVRGEKVRDFDIEAVFAARQDSGGVRLMPSSAGKSVALVPVYGLCNLRLDFTPYAFSTLGLTQTMKELAGDPSVSAIVLDVSSPGGMVTGTRAAADAATSSMPTSKARLLEGAVSHPASLKKTWAGAGACPVPLHSR